MIQLKIDRTGKSYSPNASWERFDQEFKNFETIEEAKTWLKNQYGNCKRVPMYQDPNAEKVGYIYSFRASSGSQGDPDPNYIEQDWVEFREVTPMVIG